MREESQNLRLALVSGNYNYVKDGAVFALNQIVKYLENLGIPVMILSPQPWEPVFPSFGTVTPVPSLPLFSRREYRLALGIPKKTRQQLFDFRPTLFHVASPDPLGYQAIRLARDWNIPVVASYHARHDLYIKYYHLGLLAPLWQKYLVHLYAPCQHVYAPSQENVAWLKKQGIGRDVRLWSRGVDHALFCPEQRSQAWRSSRGISETDVCVTFVGRLSPEKNIGAVIAVFKALEARGVRHKQIIIGDGPELKNLQTALPKAHFTGYLEGQELARAYASSDIFFFPSITETFGIVTLEAMASGLPLVCAQSMGSNDLVEHEKNGFLLNSEHTSDFVDALETLIASPEKRDFLGKNGLEKSKTYRWHTVLSRLHAHYLEALAAAKG